MTLFFSIATLFLSVAVVTIALLQWRVADNKLRLDLFDRRYKVYDATRKFLAATIGEGYTDSRLVEFNVGTSDAEFLFGAEVVEYIREIRRRAVHMWTAQRLYERLPVGDERSLHVQAELNDRLWLVEQTTAMSKTFTPYLGFRT